MFFYYYYFIGLRGVKEISHWIDNQFYKTIVLYFVKKKIKRPKLTIKQKYKMGC
jgi:hypothetical protein